MAVPEDDRLRALLRIPDGIWPWEMWEREARITGLKPGPTPKQMAFLIPSFLREILFGGAAGGGKSEGMLMAATQYADVTGYNAIIFRRTFPELTMDGGLIPRSWEWFGPLAQSGKARWDDDNHLWTFYPSGATLRFAHMQYEQDMYRYQGGNWHFVGFEELTTFTRKQYTYMFSRQRKNAVDIGIPLRMRATTNPIGPGRDWVKARFIRVRVDDAGQATKPPRYVSPQPGRRLFIPSLLVDNPHLDAASYMEGLVEMDPVDQRQLIHGDWDAEPEGSKFKRSWFSIIERGAMPESGLKWVRFWDMAATDEPAKRPGKKAQSSDPDFTAGALCARSTRTGLFYIVDVERDRVSGGKVDDMLRNTAASDGRPVPIRIEQEPGASGKNWLSSIRRVLLAGYDVGGIPSTGNKEVRANPLAGRAEHGEVVLIRGGWNEDFLTEATAFPEGLHDDQVDAVSGAYAYLTPSWSPTKMPKPGGSKRESPWRQSGT